MTVAQLIKELQRAIIVDELDEDSEVLDGQMEVAAMVINRESRHVVIW